MHQHFCDDALLEYLIIDSTVVRTLARQAPPKRVAQALGRSRGGFSTKIHVSVDQPLRFILTGDHHPKELIAGYFWPRCPGVSPAHPGTGYDTGHSAPLEPQGTRRL